MVAAAILAIRDRVSGQLRRADHLGEEHIHSLLGILK
jgi:hypothetical protein